MENKLIAFFSRAGENYYGGSMRRVEIGNTKILAQTLKELTGADLFEIEPANPYSDEYMTCIEEAKQDLQSGTRPALKSLPNSLEGYDIIYLAYPNYWRTMPMAVWTFLEHFDFSGKTIFPLCTHEGSGMGHSESDLHKLCPGAKFGKGLAVTGSKVKEAKPELERWLKQCQKMER